jgi:hypothetical protein
MKMDPDFTQPTPVSQLDVAFGNVRELKLMPAYGDIPEQFRNGKSKWIGFQQQWFYFGAKKEGLIAKKGIDLDVALRHLAAIQASFEPKHEHKEAAVAYLASLWLDDSSTWK